MTVALTGFKLEDTFSKFVSEGVKMLEQMTGEPGFMNMFSTGLNTQAMASLSTLSSAVAKGAEAFADATRPIDGPVKVAFDPKNSPRV